MAQNELNVEVRPEVVFLYEILEELASNTLQIPRFQRTYVWRRDQMTDLLDSVNKQYPIGSLLLWETDENVSTLDTLGPFIPSDESPASKGYVLDGHQRLMTLAAALVADKTLQREDGADSSWRLYWNVRDRAFQHYQAEAFDERILFPLTALLDTVNFFGAISALPATWRNDEIVTELSQLARMFQSYRIPVIRLRKTGLSEAVEIFARLNSKGQSMSADQMVSALTYRQGADSAFSLAETIDSIGELLASANFGEVDRTTILRIVLANLDEDIYGTDWTKLTRDKRGDLRARMEEVGPRCFQSVERALKFLNHEGVTAGRLLPYGLQLVLLSAFFDVRPRPSKSQLHVLKRWFWASSFSAWFGAANPSRATALLREFRKELAVNPKTDGLQNFDLNADPLPFPKNFDMRSARTRVLLLVMLDAGLLCETGNYKPWALNRLSAVGPAAVAHVSRNVAGEVLSSPANRIFRPPGHDTGPLSAWIQERWSVGDSKSLASVQVSRDAAEFLMQGDVAEFVRLRIQALQELEWSFQVKRGLVRTRSGVGDAPIDTE